MGDPTTDGGDQMSGRNNRPDNDGSAASPSRLDQFGEKDQQQEKQELKERVPEKECK